MSEENKKHLVVAAAGTGGHVFPALAVARELRNRGWKISWIGTQTGMESKLIAKDAIDLPPAATWPCRLLPDAAKTACVWR